MPAGDGAFPHHRHPPALRKKLLHHLPIPPPVALQLAPPELRVGAGQAELGAVAVGVPEAAVHKDDGVVAGQHNVGASCQAAVVLAEAEAVAVELGANLPLRPVLRAADAGHGVMALFRGHGVHGDEYTTFALREEWIPLLLLKCHLDCKNLQKVALCGHEYLVTDWHCPWHLSGGRMYFRPVTLYPSWKYYCNDIDFHPVAHTRDEN